MRLAAPLIGVTQAMGEYAGPHVIRDISRNLFRLVSDNLWYLVGGLAVVIVVWLYVRR